jgi:hypothetical protein
MGEDESERIVSSGLYDSNLLPILGVFVLIINFAVDIRIFFVSIC